ncbi:MAG: DUF4258 domain-containing protein [Chloroflexi bacterium]|uniref:DUF4258 domain-containing protein n=1 Tax=Candidatus Chlorohelix allophototropha TaxID=3003348 RepID=A0A8T7M4N5_9CHLR|nr:DUF4258 domain-containing protein [Chloroflexota bacterium]WJW70361.1 DUF4258 domain-containing protein [Chloroflexota bacterium L227-S17]
MKRKKSRIAFAKQVELMEIGYRLSRHAWERMQQRNLSQEEIYYAIKYGQLLRRNGLYFHFLAEKDIPTADCTQPWIKRIIGLVVLVDPQDKYIITAYRHCKGLREIKKLPRYRFVA